MCAQPPHTGCKGNHFYHRNVCVWKETEIIPSRIDYVGIQMITVDVTFAPIFSNGRVFRCISIAGENDLPTRRVPWYPLPAHKQLGLFERVSFFSQTEKRLYDKTATNTEVVEKSDSSHRKLLDRSSPAAEEKAKGKGEKEDEGEGDM